MRAARLLRILLLLQNRGRLTSVHLAAELEVAPRTILRDLDALTEAGLPIIVHRGNQGGIELGFNYRTRLTGLSVAESEAMALILFRPMPELDALGIGEAVFSARSKLLESFPETVRRQMTTGRQRFAWSPVKPVLPDPRLTAMAEAVRNARVVRLRVRSPDTRTIHPTQLIAEAAGWAVRDALAPDALIPVDVWGDIHVSAQCYASSTNAIAPRGAAR